MKQEKEGRAVKEDRQWCEGLAKNQEYSVLSALRGAPPARRQARAQPRQTSVVRYAMILPPSSCAVAYR